VGLSSSLTTVLTALHATQRGLDLVAGNISNADTEGYTRKSLQVVNVSPGTQNSIGVRVAAVQREIDLFVQTQYRTNLSSASYADVQARFASRLDQLYGQPGEINAFDTFVNNFTSSMEALAATPEDPSVRLGVMSDASSLAQHLQSMTTEIQRMRAEAEQALSDGVDRINQLLGNLQTINTAIVGAGAASAPPADMLDDRDRIVTELSNYMDLRVHDHPDHSISLMTPSGMLLFDRTASTLEFDARPVVSANATWTADPATRELGTIMLSAPGGYKVDLVADGTFRSGELAGLVEARDSLLVEAQTQLDEFAHMVATALSSRTVDGVSAVVGLQEGFDLDVNDMLAGNEITLTYTDTGTPQTVRFLRVDDASKLPLSNDVTADPNDTVYGIDFSGGTAAVVAQMALALGGSFTVSDEGGGVIRILDDGGVGTIDIDGLNASVTNTVLTDQGTALPFFVDSGRNSGLYTNSLDGEPQKIGFAGRITVNPDLIADPSRLVIYETGPNTPSGDATRPNELLARLNETVFTYSSDTGIGTTTAPYAGSVASFARQIISFQGAQSANLERLSEGQEIIVNGFKERLDESSKVSVDQELAQLIRLQTAYAANARILSAVDEMMQILMGV